MREKISQNNTVVQTTKTTKVSGWEKGQYLVNYEYETMVRVKLREKEIKREREIIEIKRKREI